MTTTDFQVRQAVQVTARPERPRWQPQASRPQADRTLPPPQAPVDPAFGEGISLTFQGRTIRAIPVNGVPWFGLPDLADALGISQVAADRVVHSAIFPSHGRLVCYESPEPDPEITSEPGPVTVLSPVCVWWLTHLTDGGRGQSLASWAKREAARLCPKPLPGDPAVFLTLAREGVLPPYPWKYSGRRSEWIDLRWSPDGITARDWTPPALIKETCQ